MKKFLSLLLAFVVVLSVFISVQFTVAASTTDISQTTYTSGSYIYEVQDDGTAKITDYIGLDSELTIPSTLGGYKVTSIGDRAFYECNSLTTLIIPEGVTSIGMFAFYKCINLTSITIPEGVISIGNSAFYKCINLTSITIPSSVKVIGNSAIGFCSSLTSVVIPEGVTSIGEKAFWDCTNLASITIYSKNCSIGDQFILLRTTIYCLEDSTAQRYADHNKIKYVLIDESSDDNKDTTDLGDIDGDKKVSIMDATEIQRHIAQLSTIPEDRLSCADTDKDTRISIMDATMIQRFIAQLIPEL